MENLYDKYKYDAQKEILISSAKDLFTDNFENHVYENTRIKTPYLNKEQTLVLINKKVIELHNAPSGVSFTPGQSMEFALFKVPIVGDHKLFATIVSGQFYDRLKMYDFERLLIYEELSPKQIIGNDLLIEEIKGRAKQAINGIQNALDDFKKNAELFNENELKKFISSTIQIERD